MYKRQMEALDGLPPVKVHCSLLAEEAILSLIHILQGWIANVCFTGWRRRRNEYYKNDTGKYTCNSQSKK